MTFQSMIWKIRTAIQKRWIGVQDKLGFFPYQAWIAENEKRDVDQTEGSGIVNRPLVSILIPCDESSARDLLASLNSLFEQVYPNWEACLALYSDSFAKINDDLTHLFQTSERIHIIRNQRNQGFDPIRAAFEQTSGEFVVLLQPGDTLSLKMLYETIQALNRIPQLEIIYFDEDHLTVNGKTRCNPFFKPDWSPELLLSTNFLFNAVFRRSLMDRIVSQQSVGQPINFADLVMLCAEQAQYIHHIPKILYQRQQSNVPPRPDDAPASDGQCRVVQDHLNRIGIPAKARIKRGSVRVTWPVSGKKISIIIPTKDHLKDLNKCIASILNKTTYSPYELVLVDSSYQWEASQRYYQKHLDMPNISILRFQGEFNYSAALNSGARSAHGDIFLFLNNDTQVVDPDWLEELVRWADRPEVGIVGAKLLYPNGSIQHAGIVIGMEGHASHIFAGTRESSSGPFGSVEWYRNYSAVTGACMAIRRELFEHIGGFDESFRLVFSDVEICLRLIRQGYRVVYTPFARLIHRVGKTRSNLIPPEDIDHAYQHFKEIVQSGDPYFNPNLSYMVRIPTFRRRWEEAPPARLQNIVKFSRSSTQIL